jgi:hypothetical protein
MNGSSAKTDVGIVVTSINWIPKICQEGTRYWLQDFILSLFIRDGCVWHMSIQFQRTHDVSADRGLE